MDQRKEEAVKKIRTTVEMIVKNLVSEPGKVKITESKKEELYLLTIEPDKPDTGKVLGRNGNTIQSIRQICYAIATKAQLRIYIEVKD